jgi:hypothetical protein
MFTSLDLRLIATLVSPEHPEWSFAAIRAGENGRIGLIRLTRQGKILHYDYTIR